MDHYLVLLTVKINSSLVLCALNNNIESADKSYVVTYNAVICETSKLRYIRMYICSFVFNYSWH